MPRVRIKTVPKANNGLQIEDNNFKMLSPNTLELKGDSHSKGGQNLTWQNTTVEAEGGEPISIDDQNNLVIFGALNIPGTKRTFKSAVKEIGKEEGKAYKMQDKASSLIQESNPFNQYSSLTFNSGTVLQDAAQQNINNLKEQKQELADMQQFLLDLSESTGKKPEKIASTFQKGGKLKPIMREGGSVAERHNNPGNVKFASWMTKYGATKGQAGTDGGNFAQFPTVEAGQQAMVELLGRPIYRNKTVQDAIKTWTGGASYSHIPQEIRSKPVSSLNQNEFTTLLNTITTGEDSKLYNWDGATRSPFSPHPNFDPRLRANLTGNVDNPIQLEEASIVAPRETRTMDSLPMMQLSNQFNTREQPSFRPIEQSVINELAPSNTRPSARTKNSAADMNKLGLTDFLSEIPAIFDRPDYVQGQRYEPQLYTPFQVSFQDRINQNNSSFRAVAQQLPNNPQALSVLASQKYNADNQVLAEQFRTNQQIANQITNQNVGILNDATLKNLELENRQYMYQEQARAITDARRDQAISSISNKFTRNRRDNNSIRMYESMSDFRLNPNYEIEYQGGPATFGPTLQTADYYSPEQLKAMAARRKEEEKLASQKSTRKWGGFVSKKK